MVVTPVFMVSCSGRLEGSFRVVVWIRTPGTSVREFFGPGVCRPIERVGRRSRLRRRLEGVLGEEEGGMDWVEVMIADG